MFVSRFLDRTSPVRRKLLLLGVTALLAAMGAAPAAASEADLRLPDFSEVSFLGGITGSTLLQGGLLVCVLGLLFGLMMYVQLKNMPVHRSMREISELIFETCKTYLVTQGKFILILEVFIGAVMIFYFGWLRGFEAAKVVTILLFSLVGIAGSYFVAWFGIRVNTFANSRSAFASLQGKPFPTYAIPLKAGISIGMLLISTELFIMLCILLFVPRDYAGPCFIGFAIGESLGAAALRIAGGIFTKIADIGSDLMKIVFKVNEDDPRNPGVIADCTGDNAGDSVGPTADGFETYGVTGVALISFITLALTSKIAVNYEELQVNLIVWIFAMRVLMDFMSGCSYVINEAISKAKYAGMKFFDFEQPLTRLIWIASILCITTSFGMSWLLIRDLAVVQSKGGFPVTTALPSLWWQLAAIISCGTLAAVLIPEFTK
ncbi:MAG: sodium/proton-translocating pyrophosphatase, partial [Thermoanaerobaculia bacterium]